MDSTIKRKAKITTAAISWADFYANTQAGQSDATIRAWLLGLGMTTVAIASDAPKFNPTKHDTTHSMSGVFATHAYGHKKAEDDIKLFFNNYARPPKISETELRGLVVFLDFDGDGAPGVSGGAEETVFVGIVGIDAKEWTLAQDGMPEISLKVSSQWYQADI